MQARVLDRWPDGSVRWTLLDWQVSAAGPTTFRLSDQGKPASLPANALQIDERDGRVRIDTGRARFEITANAFPFAAVDGRATPADFNVRAGCVEQAPRIERVQVEEAGPLRAAVALTGLLTAPGSTAPLLNLSARLEFFAGSATVRIALTLHNPRRARHAGGIWQLGDEGAVFIEDASFRLSLPAGTGSPALLISEEMDAAWRTGVCPTVLYQDSSGGANWQSPNHRDRTGAVPLKFRGYRLEEAGAVRDGLRATPILALERGGQQIALALPQFWQNFPKAIEADDAALTLRLFPKQSAAAHELQGGEQKTHVFYAAFAADEVTERPLEWCRQPLFARAEPDWYCASGAVPALTPRRDDPNEAYLRLVDNAIAGDDTFEHKRELVDEYGWRHFGEVYGDHEAVKHTGPTPLVSHYNNQYDAVAGFAYQFLRSGDRRWFQHMQELAAHVIDIDVYHTDQDRAAYNHGLFWHTVHYIDAGLATHRSYPAAPGVHGGGPGNEHNYTSGLLLHYFLTGQPQARATVLDLARWVVAREDGRRTKFRWLAGGPTGAASATVSPLYHGPGRGGGNSINALIDARRLDDQPAFRNLLEDLIRRCVHPHDDIDGLNLPDTERRWSYTVFLQALGKFLDDKIERGELDGLYAYARASLLHYARWMAVHEVPALERPERLDHPTETWAAQDIRKALVLDQAARFADSAERGFFRTRAEFFFQYSITTLPEMKTHKLARPVIVLLGNGCTHAYWQQHSEETAPPPPPGVNFGRPRAFDPQKARALRRAKMLVALAAGAGLTLAGWLVTQWLFP